MSLLEEENIHLRARVSELEGNNNVFPTNILYIFLNAFLIFDKQRSSRTPLSPMSHTQPSSETPLSPMSQQPNLTHEKRNKTSTDERPSNPNQDGKPDDEVIFILEIIVEFKFYRKKQREMNETPSSPIAPKSIETPVYTPSQTQQIEREPSDDTPALDTQVFTPNLTKEDVESRVQNPFEIGANVEISSQDDNTCHKWYPGNVLATYLVDGVEMVKVEYSVRLWAKRRGKGVLRHVYQLTEYVPQPPPERSGVKKSYELMQGREAFDNGAWCAGKVKVILFDGSCFVSLNNSTEQIYFNHSEMRKPRKWVDGMEEEQTQSVNPSEGDGDKKGKPDVGKKKKANAQPVDLLPFLQRKRKRPIRPRNPPIPVTPEVILPIDPFVTPEFPRFSRLAHWMDLRGIYIPFYINGKEIEKEFFQKNGRCRKQSQQRAHKCCI
uniref:Agenet domain-containing protein n=1 Tax=Brassica campestris TaxID=3711 RepID=A0A3P6D6J7_BRACM|nr:unnamed protein product [Brassica rapa]